MLISFLNGFLLAFALILPFGPQNIFLFNIGAMYPRYLHAWPALVTAAIADTLLILLAVLGASLLLLEFPMIQQVLMTLGILFLIYIGWSIWRSVPVNNKGPHIERWSKKKQIALAASFSLLNPQALIDTIAIIGVTAFTYEGYDRAVFTLACIMVSWIWFFALAYMGRKILGANPHFYRFFNRASACLIWANAGWLSYQHFF
jgi:L-lysine exporter family protein LysE/ArgO